MERTRPRQSDGDAVCNGNVARFELRYESARWGQSAPPRRHPPEFSMLAEFRRYPEPRGKNASDFPCATAIPFA